MKNDLTTEEWTAMLHKLPSFITELIENAPQKVSNIQPFIEMMHAARELSERHHSHIASVKSNLGCMG